MHAERVEQVGRVENDGDRCAGRTVPTPRHGAGLWRHRRQETAGAPPLSSALDERHADQQPPSHPATPELPRSLPDTVDLPRHGRWVSRAATCCRALSPSSGIDTIVDLEPSVGATTWLRQCPYAKGTPHRAVLDEAASALENCGVAAGRSRATPNAEAPIRHEHTFLKRRIPGRMRRRQGAGWHPA